MRTSVYTIFESARCIGQNELPDIFDDYFDTEKEPVPGYETDEYWQFNEIVNQVEGEEFFYDLGHSKLNDANTKFLVTGYYGYYEHYRKARPIVAEGIEDAINACLEVADTCEVEFKDGSIIVHAHHHDGCNWFEVRRLSTKGASEASKRVSSKRTIKLSPDWFDPLKLNEIYF